MRTAFMNDGVATLTLKETDDDFIVEMGGTSISYSFDTLENVIVSYIKLGYKLVGYKEEI